MTDSQPTFQSKAGTDRDGDGTEIWDDSLAPGGWVCAICRNPVESEPCPDHYPEIGDKRTHQWKRLFHPEDGTLCGQSATHHLFPKFRMVNMSANPGDVTCGDCSYLMQKIEGGPISV